jgi:methionyl-tRNA formyltransferase
VEQSGEVVVFKRRKPEESNMKNAEDIRKVYDLIRMLDAEGYPHAFLETDHLRIEFTQAVLQPDKTIEAHVRITEK